ncbi:non-ribosomal peptide synthetase [Streptomyces fildesensis]|uniref:non-ribosomal peptide synthetase n=1 Tax=Streptomyces fildesensis TaxID=375757 RepID=UPI0018DF5EAF|nr:non-ribosomal peptide synthetase [Streptomyces fildesensis]
MSPRGSVQDACLIHEIFSQRVVEAPQAPALKHGSTVFTYGDLEVASNQLATRLERAGVGPGDIVPVLLPRSIGLVIAFLAILKRGAAYAALDPAWPSVRIDALVKVMGAVWTITDRADPPAGTDAIAPTEYIGVTHAATPVRVTPHAPASVFFTSGSTGAPKGALTPHSGTVRLFKDCEFADLGQDTVMPLTAAVPWDGLTLELWSVLLNGGCSVVVDEPHLLPGTLRELVSADGVNCVFLTPTLFNVFVDEDIEAFEGVRQIFVAGEKVSSRHVAALLRRFPAIRVVHGYGPVEATLFVTTHQVRPGDCELSEGLPLGEAVPATGLHIWNGERLCRLGEIGELLISGAGLAVGYLGDPEKTAQSFPTLELEGVATRVYRTGDLVRRTEEGRLHFIGRADRQVKIRGHRIEPGEIEGVACSLSGVTQCSVVALGNGSGGYGALGLAFTAVAHGPSEEELLSFLEHRLPGYLVPRAAVRLTALPLNANGKTDSNEIVKLLKSRPVAARRTPHVEEPAGETERTVAGVFASVLGLDPVPLEQKFFALGGTSLGLAAVCTRLSTSLGRPLPISEVIRHASVRELARWIDDHDISAEHPLEIGPGGPVPLSESQMAFWTRQAIKPGDLSGLCLLAWRLEGDINAVALEAALGDLAARHESLHSVYGPDNESDALQLVAVPSYSCSETNEERCFSLLAPCDSEAEALRSLQQTLTRPLDPQQGEVWRAGFVPLAGTSGSFFGFAFHHIAFDGHSEPVLLSELATAYAARAQEREPFFDVAAPTLRGVHREMQQLEELTDSDAHRIYWQRELTDTPALALPTPPGGSQPVQSAADTVSFRLSNSETDKVHHLARRHATTPFTVLLALSVTTLRALTGQDDFAVGVPVSRRSSSLLAAAVGCLVDTVCVRFPVAYENWDEAIRNVAEAATAALAHQAIPFGEVVRLVNPPRTVRDPIYQFLFVYQDAPAAHLVLGSARAVPVRLQVPAGVCEVVTEVWPQADGGMVIDVTYQTDRVSNRFASDFRDHLHRALDCTE